MNNNFFDSSIRDNNYIIRPFYLNEFIGQKSLIDNLKIFINSAKKREQVMDHVLFYGPPGLGKTTLAGIIANELGVGFKSTSAPIITKTGDLASILTSIEPNDVLFIDEIHRLNANVEETLYSSMEDFKLDIIIGTGPGAKSVKLDLPRFTLIAATTRTGLISSPLLDRFGIQLNLEFYKIDELEKIILKNANILKISIDKGGCEEIAKRSRGTPRICIRLLKRIFDFAIVNDKNFIDKEFANKSLNSLEIDDEGLSNLDRKYLDYIVNFYNCGPVGIDTLSAALSEEKDTLEDFLEPFLIQKGFIQRTPRGRIVTESGKTHIMKI